MFSHSSAHSASFKYKNRRVKSLNVTNLRPNYINNLSLIALGYQLRLKGSPVPHAGRLELLFKGVWGTIYQSSHHSTVFAMTSESTRVICRQLGFSDGILSTGFSIFGPGTGPQWFSSDYLRCSGNEANIMNCTLHDPLRLKRYDDEADVSVVCKANDSPPNGKQCSQTGLLLRIFGDGTMPAPPNYDDTQ